ncbi:sulfatase-like hydrolase/transferase [Bacillus sp. FJAT-28004]|uniref:sulfatase-like hydrolase/transferase n=1 Tax=Bacillus sp. FJAT-28004 TaxID=1679165 RepID=UPI0009E916D3|nr:sulfatase-like hydrolase/transferase [Bacillus sp. FJAT-28004]
MTNTGQQPNILWISLEDTSPRMGCYGDSLARTPHIDMLASEGTLFRNAFATAGVCAPSRSSVITGMYPTAIGAHHMRTSHMNYETPELPTPYDVVPPAQVKLIPEMLRANGYYCTNNWKTDYQFQTPLTAWDENGTEAHWRNRKPDQPFFAVFNYDFTHESRMWPTELSNFSMSAQEEIPHKTDPDQVVLPPYLPDTLETRKALARQYDNLADADAFVGRILKQLEEDGLAGDTIVMLWSDHGEGLPRAKRWTYDAGIHVPLIVRWPGKAEPDRISDQLVSLIDLGPTVLAMAGIPVPRHLQGQPFMGERTEPRDYIFATRDRYDEAYDKVRAVRDNRFKYIRNDYPDQPYLQWIPFSHMHPAFRELRRLQLASELEEDQHVLLQNRRPPEELYDCANDPHELSNLAEEPAFREQLLRLRRELDLWCGRFDVWGDVPEDRMVEAMWPNRVQPQTAKPLFIPINNELPGTTASHEGTFSEPTVIMLHSSTQGASIAYTLDEADNPRWELYTGPIPVPMGLMRIRAIAVRIGYKDSEVAEAAFA